jgi:tetratricopeptide (TPR) repeat protein
VVFGPTPAPEAIALCSQIREQVQTSPLAVAQILPPYAVLHAMQGDFETARSLVAETNAILGELGRITTVGLAHFQASVELLAGEPAAAEERLRDAYERLDEMGEKALLATTAAMLAESLYAQDRFDESARLCEASRDAAAGDDVGAQIEWRSVEAKLLARGGRNAEAKELAREAVSLVAQTDFLEHHGKALLDLSDVLRMGGELDAARAAVRAGLELFEEKGDDVMAGRARSLLAATGTA